MSIHCCNPRYLKKKKKPQFFWLRSSGVNFLTHVRMRGALKGACRKYFLWGGEWRHTGAVLTWDVKKKKRHQKSGMNTRTSHKSFQYLFFIACLKPPVASHPGVQVTWLGNLKTLMSKIKASFRFRQKKENTVSRILDLHHFFCDTISHFLKSVPETVRHDLF